MGSPRRAVSASPSSGASWTSSGWPRDARSASSWPRSSDGRACSPSSTRPPTSRWRSRGGGTSRRSSSRCTPSSPSTGSSLDVELRRDRDLLPSFDDNMKAFTDALREQGVAEERRTCYVALTRAKQHLFVSSANWYGENLMAKGIGRFLVELLTWARRGGGAVWPADEPGAEDAEAAQTNPLEGYRQRFVRPWPGPARPDDRDELFAEGWRRAALSAHERGRVAAAPLEALSPGERATFEESASARRTLATHLRAQEAEVDERPARPSTVSVGGLIGYT